MAKGQSTTQEFDSSSLPEGISPDDLDPTRRPFTIEFAKPARLRISVALVEEIYRQIHPEAKSAKKASPSRRRAKNE